MTVTGENSAYLRGIEWEGLQEPSEVEDLAESPVLPSGSERVELRRDTQHRIEAKILGTWEGGPANMLPDLEETGLISV